MPDNPILMKAVNAQLDFGRRVVLQREEEGLYRASLYQSGSSAVDHRVEMVAHLIAYEVGDSPLTALLGLDGALAQVQPYPNEFWPEKEDPDAPHPWS